MSNNFQFSESFPPLQSVTRPVLTTAEAAFYLNRKAQTLRIWACHESGPLRPLRLYGRLGWPADEVRRMLGVDSNPKP